ncbi:MAG: fumarate hydratase [Coriobacteriales bacterium]|nr:fumarate hydratase [Coriobacteriales bacterium]
MAIPDAATTLRPDAKDALLHALKHERSARARAVLEQLVANAELAEHERLPLCQDTGTVWVWLRVGTEECITGDLHAEVNEAVASAYREAHLRMSTVSDALLDRSNRGDNGPAFLEVSQRPGAGATVHVMLKGGGSDNASRVEMLAPGAGWGGVRDVVLDAVAAKAESACPPLLVGVGVGATFDKVGSLAKRALLRPIGSPALHPRLADHEFELLDEINDLGIGPAGLGGDTTALAVHIATAPAHIAALPVAVNMGCSAVRSVTIELEPEQ